MELNWEPERHMTKAKNVNDQNHNQKNKKAILNELESVRSLLDEDKISRKAPPIQTAPSEQKKERRAEIQIPLLDPGKSTTTELDFSVKSPVQKPEATLATSSSQMTEGSNKVAALADADVPMIDDITQSGSLFDDEEEEDEVVERANMLSAIELKGHAQLIIQDLLNEIIPEIEEKLEDMIPALEEKLKKRLEKEMNNYIEKNLKN